MCVKVRNCLMGVNTIVLPNADSGSSFYFVNDARGFAYEAHYGLRLSIGDVQNRRRVPRGDDEQV